MQKKDTAQFSVIRYKPPEVPDIQCFPAQIPYNTKTGQRRIPLKLNNRQTGVLPLRGVSHLKERNSNFDLLRVFTIFCIIIFHHFCANTPTLFVTLPAEFDENTHFFYDLINNIPGSVSRLALIMDFCYGHFGNGGNLIFMTITGYFLFGRKISFPRRVRTVANILYAILFHGIVLTIIDIFILFVYLPLSSNKSYHPIFNLPNWFSGDNMWYLQVYGLFILIVLPILKLFENKLTQKKHLCLVIALIFINFLSYRKYIPDVWLSTKMENFIMCYYMGGYISRYKVRISSKKLVLYTLIYLAAYFIYEYSWRYSCATSYEKPLQYSYLDVMQPFVCALIFAVLCFMTAVNIKMPSGILSKAAGSLSTSTIGIYIFHYNCIGLSFVFADKFWWHDWSQKGYFIFVILDSLLLMIAGYVIDLFRLLSYKRFETALDDMLARAE